MRGRPTRAPYSFCDKPPTVGSPKRIETVSLSTSKENRTATRAPLGHAFGLRLLPARTALTTAKTESSDHSQPGFTPGRTCAAAIWQAKSGAESRKRRMKAPRIVQVEVPATWPVPQERPVGNELATA